MNAFVKRTEIDFGNACRNGNADKPGAGKRLVADENDAIGNDDSCERLATVERRGADDFRFFVDGAFRNGRIGRLE